MFTYMIQVYLLLLFYRRVIKSWLINSEKYRKIIMVFLILVFLFCYFMFPDLSAY